MSENETNNNAVVYEAEQESNIPAFSTRNRFCAADAYLVEAYQKGFGNRDATAVHPETPLGRQRAVLIDAPAPAPFAFEEFTRRIQIRFTAEQIAQRVAELGAEISARYAGSEYPLLILGVLKGCSPFLADLSRALNPALPVEVDFIQIGANADSESREENSVTLSRQSNPTGKNLLIVDDILDTGQTLSTVIEALYDYHPRSIRACVFLEKTARNCQYIPELRYRGFQIQGGWAVGYGMDYDQYYRTLPYVGLLQGSIPEHEPEDGQEEPA